MKKVFKFLAVILALTLVFGTIQVSAAELSLKKTSKTLFVDGCTGTKANGTKAKYYSKVKLSGLVSGYDSKTMQLKYSTSDSSIVRVSKGYAIAQGLGTATVTIKVNSKSTEKNLLTKTVKITVKKNATSSTLQVSGISYGAEYEVGQTITVKMPRTGTDTDLRALSCDSSDVVLKASNSKGSTYKVTFKKAGDYTIKAYAYMSSTYKGETASKLFEVTVVDNSEPTATPAPTKAPTAAPTATPTATPAPTATPTPEVAKIKQSNFKTVTLNFENDVKTTPANKDVKVYTKVADNKVDFSSIKSVKASGKVISIEMLSEFAAGVKYYVDYAEKTYEFVGISATTSDIAKIGITKTTILAKAFEDLGIVYYNKDGVDITEKVKTYVTPKVEIVTPYVTDLSISGSKVFFNNANKSYTIKVSATIGTTTVFDNFTISSYAPTIQNCVVSVTDGDSVYLKPTDEMVGYMTKDDTHAFLEVLFQYSDGTYKTPAQAGITSVTFVNLTVAMNGGEAYPGGYKIIANNIGQSAILFYAGTEVVGSAQIEVKEPKKPQKIELTASKSNLNTNAIASDSIKFTAKVYDQYGKIMKDAPITLTQLDASKETGTAIFSPFVSGESVLNGSAVLLKTGVKSGMISAVAKSGDIEQTISFMVADCSTANDWIMDTYDAKCEHPGLVNTAVLSGDVAPETLEITVQGVDRSVGIPMTITREKLKFYPSKIPNPQTNATELAVPEGTILYLFTVEKNGSFLSALPGSGCIALTDADRVIKVSGFSYANKLEEGMYTIRTYRVKVGATISDVDIISAYQFQAYDNQPEIIVEPVKDTSSYSAAVDIVRDCFSFKLDGKALPATAILSATMNESATAKYIIDATIVINNSFYGGSYLQKVNIGQLIKK